MSRSPTQAWLDPSEHAVELRIPADGAYLSVLRTATAGLAARLDFTLDDIEDLRLAVDEACALLLPRAAPGSQLTCLFTVGETGLRIRVSIRAVRASLPSREGFAWTVLTALAGSVDASTGPRGELSITLDKSSARTEPR